MMIDPIKTLQGGITSLEVRHKLAVENVERAQEALARTRAELDEIEKMRCQFGEAINVLKRLEA
jgi:hypothetical protein